MICRYCQTFIEIPQKKCHTSRVNDRVYVEKTCEFSKEIVNSDSISCKDFLPCTFFYCDENDQRYHLKTCLDRQKKVDDCYYCTQGGEIEKVAKLLGVIETPKIIKRNNNNQPVTKKKLVVRRASI